MTPHPLKADAAWALGRAEAEALIIKGPPASQIRRIRRPD